MSFQHKICRLFLLSLLCALPACGGGGGSEPSTTPNIPGSGSTAATVSQRLRENFVNQIVVALFSDLDNAALTLKSSLETLKANPNQANLDAAKAAWVAARIPWEQSEAALFGPADIFGIDPAIDSWPLSEGDLQRVLSSSSSFSENSVGQLENTLKGFHAIEYILFGNGGTKPASALTSAETNYAAALGAALRSATSDLLNGWTVGIRGQKPYAQEFLNAGSGSVTFPTEQLATQQVIQGLITIATEVADSKMEEPFAARNPNLVESQYSYNSTDDFANNILGIQLILERVLKELIESSDPGLFSELIAEVQAARNAILAIPRPYRDSILNPANDVAIRNAQNLIRKLRTTIEQRVLGLA